AFALREVCSPRWVSPSWSGQTGGQTDKWADVPRDSERQSLSEADADKQTCKYRRADRETYEQRTLRRSQGMSPVQHRIRPLKWWVAEARTSWRRCRALRCICVCECVVVAVAAAIDRDEGEPDGLILFHFYTTTTTRTMKERI
ncbi:unnamed protein product, partial [Ceratitis capitata]